MRELLNMMRLQALQADGERAFTRLGKISSYDSANFAVRVAIQPEGNLTGWIPLLSPWVGSGWGMFCAPTIGDMVEVQFQEADHDAAMCCMRLFNDQNRPLNVPSGEFWLQHKSGAFFKLTNAGAATFSDGNGATVTLNGDGTITSAATTWNHTGLVNITGNVAITGTETVTGKITAQGGLVLSGGTGAALVGNMTVTGNVDIVGSLTATGTATATVDVIGGGKSLKTHIHSGVVVGSANTGTPV